MKAIDIKSLLIGIFMASTFFLAIGWQAPPPPRLAVPEAFSKELLKALSRELPKALSKELPKALGAGAAPAAKQSGSDPYTPTRIEWLALHANANWRIAYEEHRKYGVSFDSVPLKPNSIIINCFYSETVNRKEMNQSMAHAREMLKMHIKNRGLGWVKIE